VSHCLGYFCTEKDPGLTCFCDCRVCSEANEFALRWREEQEKAKPDADIKTMNAKQLEAEIIKLRAGIRKHRDAKGHNLCWYVPELWNLLPEKVEPKPEPPPKEEFLHHCALYRESLEKQ
jgi:hypothetical protein